MADFQATNPGGRPLTPVKYMKVVNGRQLAAARA